MADKPWQEPKQDQWQWGPPGGDRLALRDVETGENLLTAVAVSEKAGPLILAAPAMRDEIATAWQVLEACGFPPETCGWPGDIRGKLPEAIECAIDALVRTREDLMRQRDDLLKPLAEDGWEWAMIEIFGHRSHAGRVREVERYGTKMLRIDIPKEGDPDKHGWETMHYGGSAIFSHVPSDKESVMRANKRHEPEYRYRLEHKAGDDDERLF